MMSGQSEEDQGYYSLGEEGSYPEGEGEAPENGEEPEEIDISES